MIHTLLARYINQRHIENQEARNQEPSKTEQPQSSLSSYVVQENIHGISSWVLQENAKQLACEPQKASSFRHSRAPEQLKQKGLEGVQDLPRGSGGEEVRDGMMDAGYRVSALVCET